jgi:hypothetical protein
MKGCIPDLDVALSDLTQVIGISMIELKFENYNLDVSRRDMMHKQQMVKSTTTNG